MDVRKPMRRLRFPTTLATVILLVAAAVLVAGCGSSSSTGDEGSGATGGSSEEGGSTAASGSGESTQKVTKIAIATPAKASDYGWNEQGVDAATEVAKEIGAELEVNENLGYENIETVLGQMAEKEPSLLIAHASGYATAAKRVAEESEVPTVTNDIASDVKPGELTSIIAAYQENGYLAGVLAAKTTRTGKVGIIISATNVDYFNSTGGFARGVHSVDPNMPISFAEISAEGYDDSAGGKRVATSMIAEGVDVIVGLGDDSSFGYLQAIEAADESKSEQEKVWFINAIGNMTPIDKKGVILSAMLVNFNGAYKALVEQLNEGTFGEEPYELNLANGGLAPLKTEHIPAKVWSEIEKVKEEMIAGKIKVPETTKINEVKAALAE